MAKGKVMRTTVERSVPEEGTIDEALMPERPFGPEGSEALATEAFTNPNPNPDHESDPRATRGRLITKLLAVLPHGGSLPDDAWERRHRAIQLLIWAHVLGIPIFAMARGYSLWHGLIEVIPVSVAGLIAYRKARGRAMRSSAAALGLLLSSAVLVHLSAGSIEMHFHFFVVVGILTLYEDWLPFGLAIGFVVVHHGVMGAIDPASVYDHAAAINHPWTWAAIHGAFILASSAAYVTAWRMTEDARAEAGRSFRRLQESVTTLRKTDQERRRLLGEVVRASEDERMRIAAELHDGPVQHLTALDYRLEIAAVQLSQNPADANGILTRAQEGLRQQIDELRTMMIQQRPPALDELGLKAALADHLHAVQAASGIRCKLQAAQLTRRLDPVTETVFYRVAQEALTNIVRHSGATQVWVTLHDHRNTVLLEISDDGVGFNVSDASDMVGKEHFGLAAMRERVEMLGGSWHIRSAPGAGTRIKASVPAIEAAA
jgi:signal transduction histidine kinase